MSNWAKLQGVPLAKLLSKVNELCEALVLLRIKRETLTTLMQIRAMQFRERQKRGYQLRVEQGKLP